MSEVGHGNPWSAEKFVREEIADRKSLLESPFVIQVDGKVVLDLALQIIDSTERSKEDIHFAFGNGIRMRTGSSHFLGFVDAWRRAVKSRLSQRDLMIGNALPKELDFLDQVVVAVNVVLPQAELRGDGTDKISEPTLRQHVRQACKKPLAKLMKDHPEILDHLIQANQSNQAMQGVVKQTAATETEI